MDATQRKVLVVRSGPAQSESTAAMHLAGVLHAQGRAIALVLVQDAVLCAVRASELESARVLRSLMADGTPCTYLVEDLMMRGYKPEDVTPGCEPAGYDGLVDLLLADGASVAGAF